MCGTDLPRARMRSRTVFFARATQPKATKVMVLRIGLFVSGIQSLELPGQIFKFNRFILFFPNLKLGFFGRDPKKRQVVPAMVSRYLILSASAEVLR
jgi:hypothetical protein